MQVSHETIYQALYVQGRGHLRADLHKPLRTGRAMRRTRGNAPAGKATVTDVVPISERPAEAADRAVLGHWEGDLILGSNCRSAIATLVQRSTRFVLLVHLPAGHTAVAVRTVMIPTVSTLPERLRRSLAWDRGTELARHRHITVATGLDINFCDPHSLWQRGQREHERAAAPILPERHRPVGAQPGTARPRRRRTQRPTKKDPGRPYSCRCNAEAAVARPCCDDRLKPPFLLRDSSRVCCARASP